MYFSKAKPEECDPKYRSFGNRFGIIIPCSATYFLEVGACVLWKASQQSFFRGKRKLLKLRLLDYFSKAETEGLN